MPSLGSLYYKLFLKDLTDQDLQAIEKKLKNLGIELDTKKLTESLKKSVEAYKGKDLTLGVDTKHLHDAIRAALRQPEFPIKVRVEAASAQDAVREALRRAGLQRSFTVDDKRFYDAQTRRDAAMTVAQAKAAAQNALAQQRLATAQRKTAKATRQHTSASISLGSAMRGNIRIAGALGPMLASAYSVVALKNFMHKVVEIGGELEQQKLAMKAILGNEGMANTISSQINTLAVKSPLGVMELNQYAKQLTAFQIPYNELYETMKRMADMSAAVGVDMGRIILAYGQVRAAKFLKGTELRQFTEANIPLIDMLAERFTKLKGEIVSAGDIMDMISKKEVTFEDVKAVLWDLTGEGGRFYNMQEVLSESVKAKWKNLADAIDLMFADIAESTSGPLKGLAELLTELTTRWKTAAAMITTATGVYGAYRIAILLTNKIIAANNAALFLNSIAVGANITWWQWLKAKAYDSIVSIGAKIKNFITSAKGIATVASIGIGAIIETLVVLWQRNSEEADKARQMSDDLFTNATEGARNLADAVKDLSKTSEGMSEAALQSGVDKLKNLIKDYSDTPNTDISDSLINQQGEVASLTEQYDALLAKVNELIASYKEAERLNIGKMMGESIESADGGWFDDNLLTDIKDFQNEWDEARRDIVKYAQEYTADVIRAVDEAKRVDDGFREATEGMNNYSAMYAELIRNADKYAAAINHLKEAGGDTYEPVRLGYLSFHGKESGVKKSEKELMAEWEQTLNNVRTRLLMENVDIENLSIPVKLSLINAFKKAMDGVEGPVRKQMEDKINEIIPSIKITNDDLAKNLSENFASAIKAASPKLADEIRYGKVYESLSDAERELVDKLIKQAGEDTKDKFPDYADEVQGLLDGENFTAKVYLKFIAEQKASDLQKMLWKNVGDVTHAQTTIFERWASGATSVEDIGSNAVKDGRDIKARLDAAKKNANVTKEHIQAIQKEWDDAAFAYQNAGFGSLEEAIKKKSSNSPTSKDPLAESLKQRFKDIRDAWSKFQEWSKTEGRDAAAQRIGESGLFSTLSKDEIPKTIADYRALVENIKTELKQAGVKGTARESLLNELLKQLLDIDKTVVDEQLKLALDKVSKEAERQLADWNLFDKIRKATGNQDLAMSIAFGMNTDASTDYPTLVKKQFAKLAKEIKGVDLTFDNTTLKEAQDLGDEIAKSYKDTADKLEKYAREQKDAIADILNEYQSLQDKLAKIDADRERKIDAVNRSDMSAPDKAKYIQRINVKADYDKFTQSADYLKFFSGIYSLTMDEAQEIGDKIRQNLDQRLQAGVISAEDYYKEIERINQQLTKLRNVKSDALTFLTGGAKGLQQKKLETADSDVLSQTTKVRKAQEALKKAKQTGDIKQIAAAGLTYRLAKSELETRLKIRDTIVKDMESWQKVLDVVNIAGSIAGGISDAFNSIRDMADAFGVDTESGAWDDIAAVMDTLTAVTGGVQKVVRSAMNGDVGGILGGVVSTITSPFTIWAKLHDKKLQKMIERSKQAAQIMQNQYDILEKQMANFLGNTANMDTGVMGGAYGKQRELMQGQLAELEKQRQAEIDKKKTDKSVVADYDKQIEEMKIAIQDFAIEAANAVYGIDLNGWAQQLGDSLVDAFAKGEDAAEAFDKTVGDIMRDVTKKMISQDILAPMFGDLRNFLFGQNGMGGAFGADFKLDASELAAMKTYLDRIKEEGIPAAEELFNAINNATGGLLNETDKAKSGLSAGIQSVTEDTAGLLASYINAIRASVAMNESRWERLLSDSIPQMNVIAESQLRTQQQIAENTLRSAKAAEAIMKSNEEINRRLAHVTQGSEKIHVK